MLFVFPPLTGGGGISMDHVNKVKKSSVKIVALENQTKGTGLYYMPADIESVIVIGAFVRWRQYGKSSWNYEPDARSEMRTL